MTIAEIIRKRGGRAGSNNSWKVERVESDPFVGQEYVLSHYGVRMVQWIDMWKADMSDKIPFPVFIGTGHGTVSDQGGVNTAMRVLGLPYYFSRKGGAGIIGKDHDNYRVIIR